MEQFFEAVRRINVRCGEFMRLLGISHAKGF